MADNCFPLPIVSMNYNDNILVVADGEWVAKSPNDITGDTYATNSIVVHNAPN